MTVMRMAARRLAVRSSSHEPTWAVARMPDARGAHAVPERRKRGASTNRYVTSIAHCTTDVPTAEPATPQPSPYTRATFSPMFAPKPTPATTSGVTVSWRPRSTPVAASTASRAGSPGMDQRR